MLQSSNANLAIMLARLGKFFVHLLLALSMLWGGQTAFAAQQEIRPPVASSHCTAPNTPQQHSQLPALDCLAHCALPAQISTSAPTLRFGQIWQSQFIANLSERHITPPSPPPKLSAV
ncbi:hypothetical protein HQ393_15195 [Chitinibacter bivalviorum]|uniref:DUF2946 domain-containing protein n=1 Tax=Chitinibacter bivalviorum TaxID=2739434 RepID=A0A7H9BN18_9NEIS|nr:hypothetical protein [Chitinibacter bivalviorum]QLG89481.1 hypothetical protein HQ393_15195 [Chitinibacter bivalviorum]